MNNITPLEQITKPAGVSDKIEGSDKRIVIFLVDDNKLYLKSLAMQFMENPCFDVKTYTTGEDCMKEIALTPDIVILDYFLNDGNHEAMDGLQTLALIKAASPITQVIMSSANESPEIAVHCIKQGAYDYHVKNEDTFLRLKTDIKKILGISSKEKQLMVWDW